MASPTPPKSPNSASSPTPQSAAPPHNPLSNVRAPTSSPPPTTTGQHADPKVAELQTMFPTIDAGVIEIVLESCGGSQDRTIEQLLSMNDPNFKPDELAHVRQEESSQVDLDAEFARSLQLQDEEESRQRGSRLPYQPRVNRRRPPPPGGDANYGAQSGYTGGEGYYDPPNGERGENPAGMLAMEDKLNQYAEMGKQTFSSIFNKAKAKYNEFQTTAAANTASREEAERQKVGQSRMGSGWRSPSPSGMQGTPTPGGGRGGQQNSGRNLWEDGSSRSTSFTSQSDAEPIPAKSARWQPSDAYDDPIAPSQPALTGTKIEVGGGRRSPAVGSPDKTPVPSGRIDPAKLGILPKKKVDLLSSSPSPPSTNPIRTSGADDDDEDPNPGLPAAPKSVVSQIPPTPPAGHASYTGDSDDDLEYTKNPFDER